MRFSHINVVFENPPDQRGFFTLTISRRVGGSPHWYEREVKPHDVLSSPEAARILGISVRHLYRLIRAGALPYKKQKKHLWFISKDVQRVALKRAGSSAKTEAWVIN